MQDRLNTAAGWVLGSGIVALGLSIVSSMYFHGDKPERPEKMAYAVAVEDAGGGADKGPSMAELLATGDAAKGEALFAKCAACHTINQGGANGIGPNLWATVGEAIGQGKGGFAFSSALSGHGGEWSFDNLDAWLKSPSAFASGTKMSFAGLSKPEDRANVILYMLANGGGPALPAVEAAPADDAAAADAEGAAEGDKAAAEGDAAAAPADGAAAPAADGAAAAPAEGAAAPAQ